MAGTIKVLVQINAENGTYKQNYSPGTITATQTNVGQTGGIISIGTTAENVTFTDITTEGMYYMRNLDPTNFVQWGASATTPTHAIVGKMITGDPPVVLRLNSTSTLRMIADTAACDVEFGLWET